ncbi:MAG: FAD-binding oxidoreductase [Candidatus Pacebacteria bacterium]|nr:FAD-binding oxidoreductase [Candidatus Paceibacterota bacterium]
MNIEKLKENFKGDVEVEKDILESYSHDASLFEVMPEVVVFPKDANDVKALVKYISGQKPSDSTLSITARSAGTDMSGGPLNDSIILDMTRYLNNIISIDENKGIAEPGVFYRDFEKETLKIDRVMPAYTASKTICAIGGMVSNNSGGEKTIKYGKVERYLQRQKMVFSDGNIYEIKPLTKSQLDQKMAQNDFEGSVYKKLFELIENNYDVIQKAKPKVSKNSAGYYLWNVWDRETQIFDLNKLLVGAQGTLGITIEAELGLVPVPKYSKMVVIYMNKIDRLGEVVDTVMDYEPESFESFDDYSMKLAIRFMKDFFKRLGFWGAIKLGLQFIPDMLLILRGGVPKLILMIEVTGDDEDELIKKAETIKEAVGKYNFQTKIAKTKGEIEKYWTIRRESFALLRNHAKGKRTAPFIDDIIVNPHDMPVFLPRLQEILSHYKLDYTIAGHAGNGNFHIIPLMDLNNPFSSDIILDLSEKVYSLVREFGGSITAEHNDGIIRTPYLSYMFSPEILDIFQKTKDIFDPQNIFNPGKKVGGSFKYIQDHVIKDHNDHHAS